MRILCVLLLATACKGADWHFEQPAAYLDARQQAWENFKTAQAPPGTCVSCHTGVGYILLRQALNENSPTAM